MLAFADGVDKSSVVVAIVALIPGVLAYVRGRRTDSRVNDLDTLRTIVETLQAENTEISGRLDRCETDRAESDSQIHELRREIIQLQRGE